MPTATMKVSPLAVEITRLAFCPSCKSDNTVSYQNGDGQWYCRCLTCASRFRAA